MPVPPVERGVFTRTINSRGSGAYGSEPGEHNARNSLKRRGDSNGGLHSVRSSLMDGSCIRGASFPPTAHSRPFCRRRAGRRRHSKGDCSFPHPLFLYDSDGMYFHGGLAYKIRRIMIRSFAVSVFSNAMPLRNDALEQYGLFPLDESVGRIGNNDEGRSFNRAYVSHVETNPAILRILACNSPDITLFRLVCRGINQDLRSVIWRSISIKHSLEYVSVS